MNELNKGTQCLEMKAYIGTKVINARPMNRQEYNNFRGWALPAGEDGTEEGYLLEYTDGGKANTTQYVGYVSWSPKDVFERTYNPLTGDFASRLKGEIHDLEDKLVKLNVFLESEKVKQLDLTQRAFLTIQATAMNTYLMCLKERFIRL